MYSTWGSYQGCVRSRYERSILLSSGLTAKPGGGGGVQVFRLRISQLFNTWHACLYSGHIPFSPRQCIARSTVQVVSTTIEEWNVVPDYIGNGSGDQQEIMTAICDSIKEGFDGWDCDGVATGSPEVTNASYSDTRECMLLHYMVSRVFDILVCICRENLRRSPWFLKFARTRRNRTSYQCQAWCWS